MKILNFGSLNIDRVYSVDHFIRPGETLSSQKMETFPGGKGLNQSIALAHAGAEVYHAGAVGEDGHFLVELLEQNGVDITQISFLPLPTGHAIIQVDRNGQNGILLFGGANQAITEELVDQALEDFSAGDWILLQNEISLNSYIMRKAAEKGMRIALNPSPMDDKIKQLPLEFVSLFFVNEVEGEEMTGVQEPEAIVAALSKLSPGCQVVLTLGERGAMVYDGASVWKHGSYRVPVVDTTAAGDTFTGFYLASCMKGMAAPDALELASVASSIAVSRMGAAVSIPTLAEAEAAHLRLEQNDT